MTAAMMTASTTPIKAVRLESGIAPPFNEVERRGIQLKTREASELIRGDDPARSLAPPSAFRVAKGSLARIGGGLSKPQAGRRLGPSVVIPRRRAEIQLPWTGEARR
jgi:hypothetical protein